MRWTAVHKEYEFESPADETAVHIHEVDDLFGNDADVENACLTDGAGRISLDLMRGIPSIANGQVLVAGQRVDPSDDPEEQSAPVVVQGRLWYSGSLAKGLWILDTGLPPRTMLVGKDKQRKVDGRPGCVAAMRGVSSFEVIRTFDNPILGKLDVYLAPLLEVAAGSRRAELHDLILRQQKEEGTSGAEAVELGSKPGQGEGLVPVVGDADEGSSGAERAEAREELVPADASGDGHAAQAQAAGAGDVGSARP